MKLKIVSVVLLVCLYLISFSVESEAIPGEVSLDSFRASLMSARERIKGKAIAELQSLRPRFKTAVESAKTPEEKEILRKQFREELKRVKGDIKESFKEEKKMLRQEAKSILQNAKSPEERKALAVALKSELQKLREETKQLRKGLKERLYEKRKGKSNLHNS